MKHDHLHSHGTPSPASREFETLIIEDEDGDDAADERELDMIIEGVAVNSNNDSKKKKNSNNNTNGTKTHTKRAAVTSDCCDDDEEGSEGSRKATSLKKDKLWRLYICGAVTGIYCVGELVWALKTGSLMLLSDAFHNFGDMLSLYIAYLSIKLESNPANAQQTYGFGRTAVLGGFFNACFLISLSFYTVLEAGTSH